jgi:hypothetical protein
MMKLYIYRDSQCNGLKDAIEDGALRYVGEFEHTTKGDEDRLAEIQLAIEVTAECMDMSETIRFVEEY